MAIHDNESALLLVLEADKVGPGHGVSEGHRTRFARSVRARRSGANKAQDALRMIPDELITSPPFTRLQYGIKLNDEIYEAR
jgi:hypothetical protein